jgi:dUTP pyrophosphatase
VKLLIKHVRPSHVPLPSYGSAGASGLDLRADADWSSVTIPAGVRVVIPTNIAVAIPEGCEGQVRPRSGLAAKNGITVVNTPGTIDADYRGEIKIILLNTGDAPFEIKKGDRIAQLVVCPVLRVETVEVEKFDATERGDGHFGSTGVA